MVDAMLESGSRCATRWGTSAAPSLTPCAAVHQSLVGRRQAAVARNGEAMCPSGASDAEISHLSAPG